MSVAALVKNVTRVSCDLTKGRGRRGRSVTLSLCDRVEVGGVMVTAALADSALNTCCNT